MKILFDTYPTAFQNPGGGEIIILKLKQHLEKKGISVDLFNPWQHKIMDYDLIHYFSTLNWENWYYYKIYNKKMVVTPTMWPRSNFGYYWFYRLKFHLKQILQRSSLPYCLTSAMNIPDLFLPTTEIEQKKIMRIFNINNQSKFTVIPNGIEIPEITQNNSNVFLQKYGQAEFALFVGTIAPNKNLLKTIQTCLKLDLNLFIIGKPDPRYIDYFNLCQKEASAKVVFVGELDNNSKMLKDAYNLAKVVIIASDFETCSLVGLEAASYGTPVSITQFGGTKEIFQNYVQYLDPNDMNSILSSVKSSLSKKGRDEDLKQHVINNYSWNVIADRVIRQYKNLLDK